MSTQESLHPRTPAGSPDGGKFADKPGGAEADVSLSPAAAGKFCFDGAPGVFLETAAPPRTERWNGIAVPRATFEELRDFTERFNKRFHDDALRAVTSDGSDGTVMRLLANDEPEDDATEWVMQPDGTYELDGLNWNEPSDYDDEGN